MVCSECSKEFDLGQKKSRKYPGLCKKCRQSKYYKSHILKDKDAYLQRHRFYHKKTAYGLTKEEYEAMYTSQGGRCKICQKDFPPLSERKKAVVVDHNHLTGVVRGLLCQECNKALGCVKENPEILREMIRYLEMYI